MSTPNSSEILGQNNVRGYIQKVNFPPFSLLCPLHDSHVHVSQDETERGKTNCGAVNSFWCVPLARLTPDMYTTILCHVVRMCTYILPHTTQLSLTADLIHSAHLMRDKVLCLHTCACLDDYTSNEKKALQHIICIHICCNKVHLQHTYIYGMVFGAS